MGQPGGPEPAARLPLGPAGRREGAGQGLGGAPRRRLSSLTMVGQEDPLGHWRGATQEGWVKQLERERPWLQACHSVSERGCGTC